MNNNSIVTNFPNTNVLLATLLNIVYCGPYNLREDEFLEFVNMVGDLSVIERQCLFNLASDLIKDKSSDVIKNGFSDVIKNGFSDCELTLDKNGLPYYYHIAILREEIYTVGALAKLEYLRTYRYLKK